MGGRRQSSFADTLILEENSFELRAVEKVLDIDEIGMRIQTS